MSKELLEIKKKIAEAQKKKQKELEEKSKEKISDLINSAINKKTKLEEKIKIRAQDEKNKLFILLSTKIALTLILFIILIYLIVYVNSNPVYELSKLKEIKLEDEEIKDIKSICENIYTAFQSKDYINIKKL
ncbi:MAG TPA: hypothetical protein P5239_11810 [Victivallales bacterium]|nr:hypothetical protein [Victivallales bacterium]